MNFEVNQPYPEMPRKRFPWGCLLGGCCVTMLLIAGGIGATGFFAYRFYQSQMARYTSEQPAELPNVEVSEEEVEVLQNRVDSFKEKLEGDEAVETLELSEKEVNMLISQNEDISDKVYIRIQDDLLTAEVSIPLDMLPGGKGRFFNGSVTLDAEIDNGRLEVYLQDADVQGEEIPEEILSQLSNENLAKDVNYEDDTKEWIEKFESIEVVGDKLVLTPVKKSKSDSKDGNAGAVNEQSSSDPNSGEGQIESNESPPAEVSGDSQQAEAGPESQNGESEAQSAGSGADVSSAEAGSTKESDSGEPPPNVNGEVDESSFTPDKD